MKQEHHTTTTTTATGRRSRLPPLSATTSPGQITFRLLCPASKSGAIIGKSGTVVKKLEQLTGATIRIESLLPRCTERIINVIAPDSPRTTIILESSNNVVTELNREEICPDSEEGGGEEVSLAQFGLIRVLERVFQVEEEIDEVFPTPGFRKRFVSCRLLGDSYQIDCLMGKGGKNIQKIERGSGTSIKVTGDYSPPCASPDQEVIQITGDCLAVKKAVLAVSQCLQDSLPLGKKTNMIGRKPFMEAPDRAFSDPYAEYHLHQTSFLPPIRSSSVDFSDYAFRSYSMPSGEEVVFRLLCSNDRIGGVIGKGGTIVKSLQDETGAFISVAMPVAKSDDRVIHVSAVEEMQSRHSPAQKAVVQVFTRSIKVANAKKSESVEYNDSAVEARLLVSVEQAGFLIGKGGTIISEMRKLTRTSMWVINGDQVPLCAAENDAVVQIIGEVPNVQNALFLITGRLRDTFFPNKMINAARGIREPTSFGSQPSMDLTHNLGRQATLTESMHRLGLSHPVDHSLSPELWNSRMMNGENLMGVVDTGGAVTLRGGLEHGSGSKSAVVMSATLEILVPECVLGCVNGEKESKLSRLRQISGAKVMVHEPFPGTTEARLIISGTPEQTQVAQSILQAFILKSGGSRPNHHF